MEENEQLILDQLNALKEELKQTRTERALYKRQIDDLIKIQNSDDVKTLIKPAFIKLVNEITWK